jgi:sulfur-oxidizing protein SoxY
MRPGCRSAKIRGRDGEPAGGGQTSTATLVVSDPNLNGMQMDQVTPLHTPARFVCRMEVSYAGGPLPSADVEFAPSENPQLRFHFRPGCAGSELLAKVGDSDGLIFLQTPTIRAGEKAGMRE